MFLGHCKLTESINKASDAHSPSLLALSVPTKSQMECNPTPPFLIYICSSCSAVFIKLYMQVGFEPTHIKSMIHSTYTDICIFIHICAYLFFLIWWKYWLSLDFSNHLQFVIQSTNDELNKVPALPFFCISIICFTQLYITIQKKRYDAICVCYIVQKFH